MTQNVNSPSKECGHEVELHFGSFLNQILMEFASIWLILKLTVHFEYDSCDIRMCGYTFTGKIIRMCEYSSHSLEALIPVKQSPYNIGSRRSQWGFSPMCYAALSSTSIPLSQSVDSDVHCEVFIKPGVVRRRSLVVRWCKSRPLALYSQV